jgi:hypothetical protein
MQTKRGLKLWQPRTFTMLVASEVVAANLLVASRAAVQAPSLPATQAPPSAAVAGCALRRPPPRAGSLVSVPSHASAPPPTELSRVRDVEFAPVRTAARGGRSRVATTAPPRGARSFRVRARGARAPESRKTTGATAECRQAAAPEPSVEIVADAVLCSLTPALPISSAPISLFPPWSARERRRRPPAPGGSRWNSDQP